MVQDSLLQVADSLAADTAGVDTTDTVSRITQNLEETGRALREGRFDDVYEQISSALFSFVLDGLIPAILTLILFYLIYAVLSRLLERQVRPPAGAG